MRISADVSFKCGRFLYTYQIYKKVLLINMVVVYICHFWGTLPYWLFLRKGGHNPQRGSIADYWVLITANTTETNGLTWLPMLRNPPPYSPYPMTNQRCLTSVTPKRTDRHRAPLYLAFLYLAIIFNNSSNNSSRKQILLDTKITLRI
jgi:hypothetical protein